MIQVLTRCSLDQTTRLFAKWIRDSAQTWHEWSRPQIHGYDLNCIDVISHSQFISGADEKLLRVFSQPRAVACILRKLCGIQDHGQETLPSAAGIPVLGLSNKAVNEDESSREWVERLDGDENTEALNSSPESLRVKNPLLDLDHPPTEDHLARHTLWPEIEKLYGHGYEVSAVASSHNSRLVATACRASSVQHAVIRLYETQGWREIKPPLAAHTLTVTRLRFSEDDQFLVSVGRDRQWVLFRRDEQDGNLYTHVSSNPKGHSRMILDGAWAPVRCGRVFATASRDKSVSCDSRIPV